jgi:MoxR-like ATPase
VTPEDVQAVAHDCLRHRIALGYEATAEGVRVNDVIDEIIKQVACRAVRTRDVDRTVGRGSSA